MTRMVSVQIRFPGEELRRIDGYVESGEYHSRSEFIRDAVRKTETIRAINMLRRIINEKGISEEELLKGGAEVREQLFREMFGDDE
jgi:Arc/MetJ-type ribon-helix-helix transcriptional regulator